MATTGIITYVLSHSGEMSRCIGGRRLLEVMEKLKVYGDEKLPSGSLLTI